jgi:hypothetical protein
MQLLEFLPILVFVVTYYFSDIFRDRFHGRRCHSDRHHCIACKPISAHQITSGSRWRSAPDARLQDKTFIQWKPTIINGRRAAALTAANFGTNLIQRLLGNSRPARHSGAAQRLGARLFVAGAQPHRRLHSEAFWVNYKLIGGFAITLIYILITAAYLAYGGHLRDPDTDSKRSEAGGAP